VYARSTTIMANPDRIDDGIALVDNELMSMMTHIRGCMGLSMLVDRSSGRCIATSSWESEDAMRASNEQLQPVRQRLLDTLGADDLEVQEWEIAIFHRDHELPTGAGARVTWGRPPGGSAGRRGGRVQDQRHAAPGGHGGVLQREHAHRP
jgi:hypothetical protein